MTELAYERADEPKEDIGPIRRLSQSMDMSIDMLEKSIARLQSRMQPVLREVDSVRSVPSSPSVELGDSPFARSYQEQVRRIDIAVNRIQELATDCTI